MHIADAAKRHGGISIVEQIADRHRHLFGNYQGGNPTVAANTAAYRKAFWRYTISAVALMEMVRGYQKKQALTQLQRFLTSTAAEEVIPFDRPVAELAGRIIGDLERTGQPIGVSDPLIAAIAIHHGLDLVTGNTTYFQRIHTLGYPLTILNWRI